MYQSEIDRRNSILAEHPKVVEFINDIDSELADRAFYNVSFSPEKRGFDQRVEYASRLIEQKERVQKEITQAKDRGAIIADGWELDVELWFQSFRNRMKALYIGYFHTMSTCASSMITGPANFPVERQRKRNQSADNKYSNITEYETKSPNRFIRRMLPYGNGSIIQTNAPNATELLQKKIAELECLQERMKGANKIVQKVYKKGSPEGVTEEKRIACANALVEYLNVSLDKALRVLSPTDYSGRIIAFERYQLTNNSAEINRLRKRLDEVINLSKKSDSLAQILDNGIEIAIADDGRIEIHFGYKPEENIRKLLRDNAFKFSPYRNNAWVRKLTANAAAVFSRVIKPELEKLPKI